MRDDVLRCRLKSLECEPGLTDARRQRLRRVFPDGVCDYRRRGVGQEPPLRWPTFASGPGGRAPGIDADQRVAPPRRAAHVRNVRVTAPAPRPASRTR